MSASTIVGAADTASAAVAPLDLLRQLEGWLANTGHDGAHPWRVSINATLDAYGRAPDAQQVPLPAMRDDERDTILTRLLSQQAALTGVLYGGATFKCLPKHDQDNLLWLAADLASAARDTLAGVRPGADLAAA